MWFIEDYVIESKENRFPGKKNTKYLENCPQGSLTKHKRLLEGNGIFTENKEGGQALLKRLGRSTDCGRRSGKYYRLCSI